MREDSVKVLKLVKTETQVRYQYAGSDVFEQLNKKIFCVVNVSNYETGVSYFFVWHACKVMLCHHINFQLLSIL